MNKKDIKILVTDIISKVDSSVTLTDKEKQTFIEKLNRVSAEICKEPVSTGFWKKMIPFLMKICYEIYNKIQE